MEAEESPQPRNDRSDGAAHGPLTTVGTYGTPQEAAIAQGILNDQGITAFLQGSETATMFSLGTALGGVRLQVPESHVDDARKFLDEELGTEEIPAWKCPQCGADVDAGFAVCWQCSEPWPRISEGPVAVESVEEFPGDETVNRAFRAAVIGILCCPLSLYALYLLGDARNARRSERSKLKLILAHVLAYVPIVAYLARFLFRAIVIHRPD